MSRQVRNMFDSISHRYDFVNHFLSIGRDIAWRRKAVKLIPRGGNQVLDLCGGTGDFAHALNRKQLAESIITVGDFSERMLQVCRQKYDFRTIQCDAQSLPFLDEQFTVVLNGFGMRNLKKRSDGIAEAYRVLQDEGVFIALDFFKPDRLVNKFFYNVLARRMIPLIGAFFSGKKEAYKYLLNSMTGFITPAEYKQELLDHGFKSVDIKACDLGLAYIIVAHK